MIRTAMTLLTLLPTLAFGSLQWKGENGSNFSAEITIDKNKIGIEEDLKVEVALVFPDTYTADLDALRMNLLRYAGLSEPPFALVAEEIEKTSNGLKGKFTLEPLLEGIQFFSLYDIAFSPKESKTLPKVEIISDIFEIEVIPPETEESFQGMIYPLLSLTKQIPITISTANRGSLIDNSKLLTEENQRSQTILRQKQLPWAEISGAVLFFLLILIGRLQPKRQKDLEKERTRKALTAQKQALKSLKALEKRQLPQTGNYDAFYVTLTDTVRNYIEEKFDLPATTETTQEFLHTMTTRPSFDPKTQDLLTEFLTEADKVKFASLSPSPAECQEALHAARSFVGERR